MRCLSDSFLCLLMDCVIERRFSRKALRLRGFRFWVVTHASAFDDSSRWNIQICVIQSSEKCKKLRRLINLNSFAQVDTTFAYWAWRGIFSFKVDCADGIGMKLRMRMFQGIWDGCSLVDLRQTVDVLKELWKETFRKLSKSFPVQVLHRPKSSYNRP